jgi:hypothetical protein
VTLTARHGLAGDSGEKNKNNRMKEILLSSGIQYRLGAYQIKVVLIKTSRSKNSSDRKSTEPSEVKEGDNTYILGRKKLVKVEQGTT